MENPVIVTLDAIEVLHLAAGGELNVEHLNLRLVPSQELRRISHHVHTRVNGGRRNVGRPKAKAVQEGGR